MKITYQKSIQHTDHLDSRIAQLYASYLGCLSDGNKIKLCFAGELDDYQIEQLDLLVHDFQDVPDPLSDGKSRAHFRKKAGEEFDSFAIAMLSSGDFSDTVDEGVLKYQGFLLIRSLIRDGLFHFALRVFVRDIEPMGVLPEELALAFKASLRDLVAKHYNQFSIENLERGIL